MVKTKLYEIVFVYINYTNSENITKCLKIEGKKYTSRINKNKKKQLRKTTLRQCIVKLMINILKSTTKKV